jgi:hypothetical protein
VRLCRQQVALAVAAVATVVAFAPHVSAFGAPPDYSPPTGALNRQVTQASIKRTICLDGWTAKVRPPLSYLLRLKREQVRQRRLPGTADDYDEDHFIPLELGGHPRDPLNLWPQPIDEARRKHTWGLALNHAVCTGHMTLAAAQHEIVDPAN